MNHERITELALANGFKLKEQPDGSMALNPYVFEFAAALLTDPVTWHDAAVVSDTPEVHETLMNFSEDSTGDNAVGLVRAVLQHASRPGRAWQPLTPELLSDISQRSKAKFWLVVPWVDEPVMGEYEWQQGRSPDGFNVVDSMGDGRISASQVTHVMPYWVPALPGTKP